LFSFRETIVKTMGGSKGANHNVEMLMISSLPPPLGCLRALLSALWDTFGLLLGSIRGPLRGTFGRYSAPFGVPLVALVSLLRSFLISLGLPWALDVSWVPPGCFLQSSCVRSACLLGVASMCPGAPSGSRCMPWVLEAGEP
jgi:hypothetical protein